VKKALLSLASIFLLACKSNNPNNIQIGMKVTNGYCTGFVAELWTSEAKVSPANCGQVSYNYVMIRLKDLKELK
jgi:hypothetical protein